MDVSGKRFIIRSRPAARLTVIVLAVCFVLAFGFIFVIDYFEARQIRPEFAYRKDISSTLAIAFTAACVVTMVLFPFVFLVGMFITRKKTNRESVER